MRLSDVSRDYAHVLFDCGVRAGALSFEIILFIRVGTDMDYIFVCLCSNSSY